MEIIVADDLLSILLLNSVPSSFENFRCAMESRDDLPTPETLKIKLMEEWDARKATHRPDHPIGFYSSNRKENRNEKSEAEPFGYKYKSKQKKFGNYRCHYCSRSGHLEANCYKKIADNKSREENHRPNEYATTAICMRAKEIKKSTWLFVLDSGTTSHMANDKNLFSYFRKQENQYIQLAADQTSKVTGKGTIRIEVKDENGTRTIRLENVLCVPELETNLISTSKCIRNNQYVVFDANEAKVIEEDGFVMLRAKRKGDLYYVEPSKINTAAKISTELKK